MTVMTVWAFPELDAARKAEQTLGALSASGAVIVHDGLLITWPANRRAPQPRRVQSVAITEAAGYGFWGLLLGGVFFAPALSELSGVDPEALGGALAGVGLPGEFVLDVRRAVGPGSSALMVLSAGEPAAVSRAVAGLRPCQVAAALTHAQRTALYEVFG
jgi:uncharacterized membrane protein